MGGKARINRNAAVMLLYKPDIGFGQLVAQLLLDLSNQTIGRWLRYIGFQRIIALIPKVSKIESIKRYGRPSR